MALSQGPAAHPNRILRSLPKDEYAQIQPHLQRIRLPMRRMLHEPGQEMSYVYFPNSGVLSMITVMENGQLVELATVGNEGVADLSAFLGARTAASQLLVQVPGEALRIDRRVFTDLGDRLPELHSILGRYMTAMFTLVSQSAACNQLHPIEQRTARWLLMTHDRVDSDTFPITHDFLASMLGVRRSSVTVAAGALQQVGLIHYRYGRMSILDREGLENISCECYELVRAAFEELPGSEPQQIGRRRLSSGLHATESD